MNSWFEIILLLLSLVLLPPCLWLMVEAWAARRPGRGATAVRAPGDRCVVLVPAHNEEAVLAATLSRVNRELRDGDSTLVVADNCTDGTARVARQAGATVIERTDPVRRGKGFALDFGVQALK